MTKIPWLVVGVESPSGQGVLHEQTLAGQLPLFLARSDSDSREVLESPSEYPVSQERLHNPTSTTLSTNQLEWPSGEGTNMGRGSA